jgi:hypothetical protein
MTRSQRINAVIGAQLCALALAGGALADDVPEDYLVGTWALGGAEACEVATGERLIFAADGTFTSTLDGEPSAAGFWQLTEHELELHMVSSPAYFDDPERSDDDMLASLAGQYTYYYARGLTFDVEPDDFRVVVNMGETMRGADLHRCP